MPVASLLMILQRDSSLGRVLTSSDEVSGYNTDWLRTVRGQTRCVLRPRDTQEVSFSLQKIETTSFIITFPLAINKIFKINDMH